MPHCTDVHHQAGRFIPAAPAKPSASLPRVSSARTGFTLIELLVVIAIIAVLIGLLMPAVQAARARALKIKCASNLHNVSLGITMYADTVGFFPYAAETPSVQPGTPPLQQVLYVYVDKDPHVFYCPMDVARNGIPARSDSEGLSFEYFAFRVQGKSMVQLTDSRQGTTGTLVLADFDPVHGPPGTVTARNFLYADGHLE